MHSQAPSPRVDRCGPNDREEQLHLFRRCFRKPIDRRGLVWRYDENPAGEALSFLARSGDGTGVSGYACSPRLAVTRDTRGEQAAVIGQTGDVMTDPQWRKRGLFSQLDRACMQASKDEGWPLVFGLPNRRSAHIFLELGWKRIGTLRYWTFVLQSDAAARRERARDGRLRALALPFGLWRGKRARARLEREAASCRTRPIAHFPPAVAELSRKIEKRFAFMVRRDAPYLDWRFARSPSGLHRCLAIENPAGELVGYAVVQVPREGSCVGYLADLLALSDAALAAALSSSFDVLGAAGASLVQASAIDGSWWNHVLVDSGFQAPRPDNHMLVILHPHRADHPLTRAARNTAAWYFTDGDRDDETVG
jgi:GNAT superfamily N-acetyltransferase